MILTPKEYEKLVTREAVRKYFKEKSDAIDGKTRQRRSKKRFIAKILCEF